MSDSIYRVLIVDDNPAIHEDFKKILVTESQDNDFESLKSSLFGETELPEKAQQYEIVSAYQGAEAIKLVAKALAENTPFALAFVDIRMPPGIDGVETIKAIWQTDPYIQTVICSAYSDYSWSDMSKNFGRTDRLLILKKPFDNIEVQQFAEALTHKFHLAEEVRNQIINLQMLVSKRTMQLEASVKQLEFNATHDLLTKLPNRSLLQDRIEQMISKARETQKSFIVLFIDLNRFKKINDSMGHSAGDTLLKEFSKRFQSCLSAHDTLARFGGDEFILLLNEANDEHVAAMLTKLLNTLREPLMLQDQTINISASVGGSVFPKDGDDADTLFRNADMAMYRAKKMGGNQFKFYDSAMNANILEQLQLETNLRSALENNEFILHYQPIIDIKTQQIVGIEALIRWMHPKLGLVPPQTFITIAEEIGLILPMGHWVLKTACIQNKKWQDAGCKAVPVMVSLSGLQLHHDQLINLITEVLSETQLEAQYLQLALTETMLITHSYEISSKLQDIKALGVGLIIDDFGTGYSNLNYLGTFPLDKLKIDKSFIDSINKSHGGSSIIKAIVAMAHALNLRVLAEGVEHHDQYEFLKACECDEVQGYLFSEPVPAEVAGETFKKIFSL